MTINYIETFIFTMPKSATMMLRMIMSLYSTHLKLDRTHICWVDHDECPEFRKTYFDPDVMKRWHKLTYYNGISNLSVINYHRMPPILEKVVFVYRNPLDQLLSFYKHAKGFPADDSPDAPRITAEDLEYFIFAEGALESYIKLYLTFHLMQQKKPGAILFVSYEELMHDKESTLGKIINHLGLPYNQEALKTAIDHCTIEHLKDLASGRITGEPYHQHFPHNHIRNGGIGVWQEKMPPELVARIEGVLQEHHLSLNMFTITDELVTSAPKVKLRMNSA